MNKLKKTRRLVIVASLAMLPAVAAGGCVEGEPGDRAPTIQELTVEPQQIAVGESTELLGLLEFSDDDRDVERVRAFVRTPAGAFGPTAETDVNTTAREGGTLELSLGLTPTMPGAYTVHVVVIDSRGNESNLVLGTVEALPASELR